MQINDMDAVLTKAMQSDLQPPAALLDNTKSLLSEAQPGEAPARRSRRNVFRAAMVTAVLVLMASVTVYAIQEYLAGSQVAGIVADEALSLAFGDSVEIYQSIEVGEYRFTLTEMVQGRELTGLAPDSESRLYLVLAAEYTDGRSFGENDADPQRLFTTPLLHGHDPMEYNIHTLNNAGGRDTVQDGVLYRLLDCDDITIFADNPIYLLVCDGFQFLDAVAYDENSGEIRLDADYTGASALFTLPIGKEYADTEKAKAFFESWQEKIETPEVVEDDPRKLPVGIRELSWWEGVEPQEGSRQLLTLDAEGYYNYEYFDEDTGGSGFRVLASVLEEEIELNGPMYIDSIGSGGMGVDDPDRVFLALVIEVDSEGDIYASVLAKKAD